MSGTAGETSATDRGETPTTRDSLGTSSGRAGRLASGLAVLAGCLAVAACTTDQAQVDPDLGVAPSPRVVGSTDPVPKGGGRYMTGKPYKIGGRWFTPMENPRHDYQVIGIASWYGPGFHGRRTANGEVFDSKSLSAAHPTLPLPSYIRVTNLANDRSIIVRVNDRGPFHGRRVIDVSSLAAEKLDFKRRGMARVRVEYVGPASLDGDDHEQLLASYRGPGEGPAMLPGSPDARSVMIASAETKAEERRPAAAPKQNRTTEILLARFSDRGASRVPVQQQPQKTRRQAPTTQTPAAQPAAVPDPVADPRAIELAAATPETLPGVGTALATATDPATADPSLAAATDLASASTAGMILPRPRPGAFGVPVAATEIAALPAATAAPAVTPADGAAAAPAPAAPVQLAFAYAPVPSPKPPVPSAAVVPASYQPSAPAYEPPPAAPVAAPAAPAARPSSIDDLLSPSSVLPASGFQPMTLTPAPSYAPVPQQGALEAALGRFAGGASGLK